MIKGLHHNSWRCRDSEEARRFYDDFLGRGAGVLHKFYKVGDGSYLAFFEVPGQPFEFERQHDFDLHIARGRPGDARGDHGARQGFGH
jgi:catechol 2,3-dioxygenase-like lactoylglutathione lyase family enzyme